MKKNINKINNKNFLKKIFIKLCRKIGYEIIDQNNLFIPSLRKYAEENLSEPGKTSISIPLGKVNIKRQVKDLTIIIRSYTSTEVDRSRNMLDQNKKRIFDAPKIEYTLRTINSIINSSHTALKEFKALKINLIITDDNSKPENLARIKKLLENANFNTNLISINKNDYLDQINKNDEFGKPISEAMISNMINILVSINLTKKVGKDLVYFVEDDYIHKKEAIMEMLFAYEKISSQTGKEIFLCPADYPYLYNKVENTSVFIGNKRHWRTVNETLITFLTSKEMILKYIDNFILMCTTRHHPMEKKLHEIYKKEYCLSPIPSLAMHSTNINSAYGVPPNYEWIKNWDENKV
ncbi:glycosyltransferase family 2 protein [Pelagibacteraceae bacterium]|nr:glycosyltransferase family 2 protein [Pelagibacteraceae bacterium]